jgi:hypothetical protein
VTILDESFFDPAEISDYYPIKKNPDLTNFIKGARSLSNAQDLIFIDELNS